MKHDYSCGLALSPCTCEEVAVFTDLLNDPDFDMYEFLVLEAFLAETA